MVRNSLRLAACVVLVTAGLAGSARATPGGGSGDRKDFRNEGCVAIGTHSASVSTIRPWDCYFTATGKSTYVAATPGAFVISISKDDGRTWEEAVKRAASGPPMQGDLPTAPGDRVAVSISCWDYTTNTYCRDAIGGRYGSVVAHSRI